MSNNKSDKILIAAIHENVGNGYAALYFATPSDIVRATLSGDVCADPTKGFQGYAVVILQPLDDGCVHFYGIDGKELAHVKMSALAGYIMNGKVGELLDPVMDAVGQSWKEDPEMVGFCFHKIMTAFTGIMIAKRKPTALSPEGKVAKANADFPEADGNLDAASNIVSELLSKHVH